MSGPGSVSGEVILEQSSGSPSTRSTFIQLMFPFQTELGLVMKWGKVRVREGEVEGLFMSDKAFITCLTFGWAPENPTQDRDF